METKQTPLIDLRTAAQQALEALEKLWQIIDDIDTYGDMAKADDKLYRSLVERRQRTRFEETGISTDGYTLNGGAITALRAALAQEQAEPVAWRCACGANLYIDEYGHPASRAVPVSYGQTLEEAMRETREKAQAYEAGWKAGLAHRAEPVEPVAWYRPSIAPDYYAPVFVEGAQPPAPLTQAEARLLGWRPLVPPQQAEPVEPVAWMVYIEGGASAYVTDNPRDLIGAYRALPLYTALPQRKPLTEEEIESCRQKGYAHAGLGAPFDFGKAARAVEKASWEKNHGQA